jgi:crossover junction endodeoxyribonuclease RuvC
VIAAIDPGVSGAIAIIDTNGNVIAVEDLPIHLIRSGRKLRTELDLAGLRAMLTAQPIEHVFIEAVHAMPKQGVVSMFRFGYAAGAIAGLVTGLALPLTLVRPQAWQRSVGCGPAPDAARQRAARLCPGIADRLLRKKDGNRADAVLIGRYCRMLLVSPERAAALQVIKFTSQKGQQV